MQFKYQALLIAMIVLVAVLLFSPAASAHTHAQIQSDTTAVVLFRWVQPGSGSTGDIDTSGYASGWKTVHWCTGNAADVATLTEYDDLASGAVPLYTLHYRCDGLKHWRAESNSLFNERWVVSELARDTTTLKAWGTCLTYC